MKRILTIGIVLCIGAMLWVIYSRIQENRREAKYQAALASFQHDLSIGTSKASVETYLKTRKLDYYVVSFGGSTADTLEIKAAEEPGGIACSHWTVYIAFEFTASDTLREVHIRETGTCL